MKFMRRIFLLGAVESTYGTDPGSGYQAVLTNEGTEINPEATITERNTVRSTFSPDGHVVGGKLWNMTVPIELKGGGVDGSDAPVVPEADWAFRSCGLKREDALVITVANISGDFQIGEALEATVGGASIGTLVDVKSTGASSAVLYVRDATLANNPADTEGITGSESAATADADGTGIEGYCYRPITERSDMDSVTIHYHLDGIRHVATGVRGNLEINLGVNSFGVMNFTFQGVWNLPADIANPTVSYSTVQPPVVKNAGLNIGDWDLDGAAATSLQVNLNNQLTVRNNMNALDGIEGVEITDRGTDGSVDPEVVSLSEFNPWTKWRDAGRDRIYAEVGTDAGNRIRVLIPRAQYNNKTYQNRDGVAAYQLPFAATGENEAEGGTGGDDEVYYFFY